MTFQLEARHDLTPNEVDAIERGYARALLDAFVEEARVRGARRIWVAGYDFQAPACASCSMIDV
jgi:hypothetical protein